jgi:hypothetical protein
VSLLFIPFGSCAEYSGCRTLAHAAVGITYDFIATPLKGHRHEIEDKRTSAMAVVKILDGRITQAGSAARAGGGK